MTSRATSAFWARYHALPPDIRQRADQAYRIGGRTTGTPRSTSKRSARIGSPASARTTALWASSPAALWRGFGSARTSNMSASSADRQAPLRSVPPRRLSEPANTRAPTRLKTKPGQSNQVNPKTEAGIAEKQVGTARRAVPARVQRAERVAPEGWFVPHWFRACTARGRRSAPSLPTSVFGVNPKTEVGIAEKQVGTARRAVSARVQRAERIAPEGAGDI